MPGGWGKRLGFSSIAITEEERSAVFGALEAYAGFMINASGSRTAVSQYFKGGTQTYNDIVAMNGELWMNTDRGHKFRDQEILGFTSRSDTMFSVRASMVMHVVNKDNTEKDYSIVQSMYFSYENGKWVCTEMTNEDITTPVGEVRLTLTKEHGFARLSVINKADQSTCAGYCGTSPRNGIEQS